MDANPSLQPSPVVPPIESPLPENQISQNLPQKNQELSIEKLLQLIPVILKMLSLTKNRKNEFFKMLSEVIK